MGAVALLAARVFTGDRFLPAHAVVMDGGKVRDILPAATLPADLPCEDLGAGLLAPGFVDVQVNGGGGVLFNETPTLDGIDTIASTHRRFGTTTLLPTFITDRDAPRDTAIAAVREAVAQDRPGVAGIHLEGPFLATARKGAHDPALIRPLTEPDVDRLLETGLDTVLLTVAAEAASPRQIRRLVDGGVIVSIGHSDASYDAVQAAADAGARGVTHLYNAMSSLGHRTPGVVGAALDRGSLWGGIIADGHHVHAAALRIALRAKRGPGRLFLISDAMPPAGSPGNRFTLMGREVRREGTRLTLADGTLAGCDLTMDAAVRFAVDELELSLAEALRMASLHPAAFLGLEGTRGRIAPGMRGDLVLLGDDLRVQRTWIGGEPRSANPSSGPVRGPA